MASILRDSYAKLLNSPLTREELELAYRVSEIVSDFELDDKTTRAFCPGQKHLEPHTIAMIGMIVNSICPSPKLDDVKAHIRQVYHMSLPNTLRSEGWSSLVTRYTGSLPKRSLRDVAIVHLALGLPAPDWAKARLREMRLQSMQG